MKKVKKQIFTTRSRRDDNYYRYMNLSDLWERYSVLLQKIETEKESLSLIVDGLEQAAGYLRSAIELEERALIENKRKSLKTISESYGPEGSQNG